MKIVARKPTCADRYPVQLTAAVAFDGNVFPASSLVEVSDMQACELIAPARGDSVAVAADEAMQAEAGSIASIRPGAVMEWADSSMTPRQRKKWRPSRIGMNRVAPRGSVRLDAGSGIIEQVRRIVDR